MSADALADEYRIRLPSGEEASVWASSLNDAQLRASEDGAEVVVEVDGDTWWLVVQGVHGPRRASLPAPRSDRDREAVAWLAVSLLDDLWTEVGPPPLALVDAHAAAAVPAKEAHPPVASTTPEVTRASTQSPNAASATSRDATNADDDSPPRDDVPTPDAQTPPDAPTAVGASPSGDDVPNADAQTPPDAPTAVGASPSGDDVPTADAPTPLDATNADHPTADTQTPLATNAVADVPTSDTPTPSDATNDEHVPTEVPTPSDATTLTASRRARADAPSVAGTEVPPPSDATTRPTTPDDPASRRARAAAASAWTEVTTPSEAPASATATSSDTTRRAAATTVPSADPAVPNDSVAMLPEDVEPPPDARLDAPATPTNASRRTRRDRANTSHSTPVTAEGRTRRAISVRPALRIGGSAAWRGGHRVEGRGELAGGVLLVDHVQVLATAALSGPTAPTGVPSADATPTFDLGAQLGWTPPWRVHPELSLGVGASLRSWRENGEPVAAGWVPWVSGRAALGVRLSPLARLALGVVVLGDVRPIELQVGDQSRNTSPIRTAAGLDLTILLPSSRPTTSP